jgi:hypothetical protein
MPFSGDFTVTQNSESDITLTDTSTGSDPTITSRTITITDYLNRVFYTTTWSIADASKTLTNLLDRDYAFNITVTWNAPTPDPTGVYQVTKLMEFDFYSMIFLGQLIAERFARYPTIRNDRRFADNFLRFYSFIVSARIATGLMNDITKSQMALNEATLMKEKQTINF